MMKTLTKVTLGAGVLAVALAGIALADSDQGGMHGPDMGMNHGTHGGAMQHGAAFGEHLSTLKTELKLTSQQEPAWAAFEKVVRNQKAEHGAGHGPGRASTQTGTDPMESRIAFMEQRLAGMKVVAKARQDLYKVLTPEQKTIADRFFHGSHA